MVKEKKFIVTRKLIKENIWFFYQSRFGNNN
jgi:hypothetical protein